MEYKLSDAEQLIMEQFWLHGALRTDQLAPLVAEKGWKPTTLLTFLKRLSDKGMLTAEKQGKSNLYRPLVGQNEYLGIKGQVILEEMYGGSVTHFVAALAGTQGLSAADISELRNWLAQQEVELDD